MTYSEPDFSLPSAPSLIGSEDFKKFEEILQQLFEAGMNPPGFKEKWRDVMEHYRVWESTFAGLHTSTTNRKLQLYRFAQDQFPGLQLLDSKELTDVVLAAVPGPGEKMVANADGEYLEVLRREITERLGILLTLRGPDGRIYSREFFD